jgi:hypothetical protein
MGTVLAAIGAAALLAGCSAVGEAVMDQCTSKRSAYEWTARKVNGLKSRNVAPDSPTLERALEDRRRARKVLAACETA